MYMMILMIYTCLTTYLGDGPMWPKQIESAQNCRESWWTNLLYVNNLVLVNKQVRMNEMPKEDNVNNIYIYNYDYAYSVWHVLCCPFSVWLGRGSLQMTCSFTSSPLCFSFSSPCKCLCQTFGLWQSLVSTSMFCVCSDYYNFEHISPQL